MALDDDYDDLPPPTPDEIEWEEERSHSLRTFEVVLFDGAVRHIFAHFWDNDNSAGHLKFYTVQPSGRQLILNSIAAGHWTEVREVTPPDVAAEIDQIVRRTAAKSRGQQACARMRRESRRVH